MHAHNYFNTFNDTAYMFQINASLLVHKTETNKIFIKIFNLFYILSTNTNICWTSSKSIPTHEEIIHGKTLFKQF